MFGRIYMHGEDDVTQRSAAVEWREWWRADVDVNAVSGVVRGMSLLSDRNEITLCDVIEGRRRDVREGRRRDVREGRCAGDISDGVSGAGYRCRTAALLSLWSIPSCVATRAMFTEEVRRV